MACNKAGCKRQRAVRQLAGDKKAACKKVAVKPRRARFAGFKCLAGSSSRVLKPCTKISCRWPSHAWRPSSLCQHLSCFATLRFHLGWGKQMCYVFHWCFNWLSRLHPSIDCCAPLGPTKCVTLKLLLRHSVNVPCALISVRPADI